MDPPSKRSRGQGNVGPGAWRLLSAGQGAYFTLTGIWPVMHMTSFVAVTGPKTDWWLVRLVGAMIAWRGRLERPVWMLGFGMPVVLAVVDVVYVARGTIGPVYLLDAAAEVALAAWWVVVLERHRTCGCG